MPTTISHRPARQWLQIDIPIPAELSDYVSHELTRITGNGVQMISSNGHEVVIGYLEKNETYGANRAELDRFLAELSSPLDQPIQPVLKTLIEENWAENWKENYQPSRITDTITVKPTWSAYSPAVGEVVIAIDPGMAFGTGLHSSTRLALTFIDQLFTDADKRPRSVLDVGTGTGILALACAKLGAEDVVAIDNDIDAVVAARDNIAQNHEAGTTHCSDSDLAAIAGTFDLVIANITADVLTALCLELVQKVAPAGHLILAGILGQEQAAQVQSAFKDTTVSLKETKKEENWFSLLFAKESA